METWLIQLGFHPTARGRGVVLKFSRGRLSPKILQVDGASELPRCAEPFGLYPWSDVGAPPSRREWVQVEKMGSSNELELDKDGTKGGEEGALILRILRT